MSFSCLLWLSISIHAPPRGATRCAANRHYSRYFNSRPSARGDASGQQSRQWPADFNSRPSARGDARKARRHATARFQFTPLREGRRGDDDRPRREDEFQFTPLREGRRPKGAAARNCPISIHAPPRGATHPGGASRHAQANFNSRPSARGDDYGVWRGG